MQKILVAGMGSCGSTLLYNIIRFCIIQKDIHYVLQKTHRYIKEIAENNDVIFTAKRDIRDVVASWKRRKPGLFVGVSILSKCIEQIQIYLSWKDFSDYEFVFEKYKNNRTQVINEICTVLKIENIDIDDIKKKIDDLSNQRDLKYGIKQDHKIVTSNHIGQNKIGGYKELLTVNEIKIIESAFPEWLYNE